MALKAVDYNTSALLANMSNEIVALNIDSTPLPPMTAVQGFIENNRNQSNFRVQLMRTVQLPRQVQTRLLCHVRADDRPRKRSGAACGQ